jgi:nucleoside phosphorylase
MVFKVTGPLACGSSVVANRAVVEKQVLSLFPKTVGLDMESYSVAFTCQNCKEPRPTPILVKSICDFADSEKSDQYQKFAAYTSAGYTKYLLENILPL